MAHYVEQIIAKLNATPSVTALVGNRIHADNTVQEYDRPFIIFELTDEEVFPTINNNCLTGVALGGLTMNIVAESRAKTVEVYKAVFPVMRTFQSEAGETENVVNAVNQDGGQVWSVLDPIDGSDSWLYLLTATFEVDYHYSY